MQISKTAETVIFCTMPLPVYCKVQELCLIEWSQVKSASKACVVSVGPDQTAHTRSLIRVFADRLTNRWIL